MKEQPFKTTLTAVSPVVQLGDPVFLLFEMSNMGTSAYQVLKWGTPLEGELRQDCFVVERDGQRVRYDGKVVKRGDPGPDDYLTIEPGQTVQQAVELSQVYAIDQFGEYKVTLAASFSDAFAIPPGNAKQAPRKRGSHAPHPIPPATATFKVVSGGAPRLTLGQAARKMEQQKKLAKGSAKAPTFVGGTAAEQDDVLLAHNNAQYFAALAARQLQQGPANTNALYQTWFGAFDQGRYDTIRQHFESINSLLLNEGITYDLTCNDSSYAYTYHGVRTVWLCNAFWPAPQIGTDCKFGTLIHEWSHALTETEDHVYGTGGAQNLATNDPDKAIDNADNHEYFAESLAQSDFGKSFTFITDRSTFGKDEVDALLANTAPGPAVIDKAFYVVADGFWPGKLGITSVGASPSIKPSLNLSPTIAGLAVSVTALEAEDADLPEAPQRFTWVCQVAFTSSNGFPTNAGQELMATVTATLNAFSSAAPIRLVKESSPYELDGATSWLSTDVRVFQIRAGDSRFGIAMGAQAADAPTFIKQVLTSPNLTGASFEDISTDQQTSVLELAEQPNGTKVFNFAIARVRYRGTIDLANVRVFFRLFPSSTPSTGFDATTTYRRSAQGGNIVALPGVSGDGDLLTIPCFAEPRLDSSTQHATDQTDPANVKSIAHDPNGGEVSTFFGCWLDINQPQPQYPVNLSPVEGPWTTGRLSIQQLMRSAHQCLVAEISYDPDPIAAGATPGQSDKLAQRNLAIVESANPGLEASRRILTPFELRPVASRKGDAPDELLIEWGNLPRDSVARLFIPEIDVSQVMSLASARHPNHRFTQVDGQTLELSVGGIAYVPLPPGIAFGLTALLSISLPGTVRKGEVYTAIVRQVTDASPIVLGRTGARREEYPANAGPVRLRWRRVVGSYQITIPVRTKQVMLARDERLLSVLRWILRSVPTQNRWHPVFSRYVALQAERVDDLGGDAGVVKPSPRGDGAAQDTGRGADGNTPAGPVDERPPRNEPWLPQECEGRPTSSHAGKVVGLIYDCFGDFDGFVLDKCCRQVTFQSREGRIESLARIAWQDRVPVTVMTVAGEPRRPLSLILREPSRPTGCPCRTGPGHHGCGRGRRSC